MKIVDAVWEKRNLGVDTVEAVFEVQDSVDDIKNAISQFDRFDYAVVKCPSDHSTAVFEVQKHGFEYIETALSLSINPSAMTVSPKFENIIKRCSYMQMNDRDIEIMENQINKGIFSTDRISLDPHFSPEISASRYINWIRDLNEKGNPFIKVLYDNETVGFFINNRISNDVYDGILAGVYESYLNSGMGFCVQWAGVDYVRSLGAKRYLGHISLNNPGVLKVLMSLGYNITKAQYVFVRHGGSNK